MLLTHQSLSRRKADGNKSFGRSGTCRRPTGREDELFVGSDESEREGTTLSISKLERVGTSCRAFILRGVRWDRDCAMYKHMETGDRTLRLYRVFIIGLIDNESAVGDYGIEMSRRGPTKREMESYRR